MVEEFDWFVADSDVLLWQESIEVCVDGLARRAGWCKDSKGAFLAIDNVNEVTQHVEDSKVVLNDDDSLGF